MLNSVGALFMDMSFRLFEDGTNCILDNPANLGSIPGNTPYESRRSPAGLSSWTSTPGLRVRYVKWNHFKSTPSRAHRRERVEAVIDGRIGARQSWSRTHIARSEE